MQAFRNTPSSKPTAFRLNAMLLISLAQIVAAVIAT